ncbi:DNA repair and recombination protein RadA, partial [Candidatus Pacearchaeota archaeon]|nr:DNA repair and recombination protein RadA [Candidatus Pacearchaeota archaeon]
MHDARNVLGFSPITAAEFFAIQEEKPRLMTGSSNLDDILGGGVPIGAITEFSGAYGSGKTQICFQLCVTVQLPPEQGGLGGKAYFIDTEGTFSPRRMIEMAMAQGVDRQQALKNILVSKAYNVDHMILLVTEAKRLIPQENIKLLVIDS